MTDDQERVPRIVIYHKDVPLDKVIASYTESFGYPPDDTVEFCPSGLVPKNTAYECPVSTILESTHREETTE